jgi:hypothetical protein
LVDPGSNVEGPDDFCDVDVLIFVNQLQNSRGAAL